ncbi:hypothetical protein C7212DRAFT_365410 [Tuber magnatum]|uniref:Uncharacterized protein n=1 Tax=Tuber magnatum TaxID=42249 RepID=A0A317SID3_9PEZI|nr:hypothetical protein C7212DRAFT_365410 [Tuber magnatum]
MEAMLVRSPLASYCFTSGTGANIRVCFQDQRGRIRMSCYNEKSGWTIGTSPGSALLNNGMAVTGWNGGTKVHEISMVGGFMGDKIVERCRAGEGDWGNLIREVCKDGGDWSDGRNFPLAIPGRGIACSQIPGIAFQYWLFYQKPNTTVVEYVKQVNSPWEEGNFRSEKVYSPGASITCTSSGTGSHRVFTISSNNRLFVTEFNAGHGNRSKTRAITRTITSSPTAAISAVDDPWPVRIYFQAQGNQITEWGTDNDLEDYDVITPSVPTGKAGQGV